MKQIQMVLPDILNGRFKTVTRCKVGKSKKEMKTPASSIKPPVAGDKMHSCFS